MPDLEIRPAADGDLDAILDLVRLTLGEGRAPRTRDYWVWKHLANPFGRSYFLVAEAGGALVGLRAFMRWTWWSAGQPVPAVRAVDTVTHPEWRGQGIFTRLTLALVERVRSEGAAFVFNTPNRRSRRGYLKMGWVPVGRLTPWVGPRASARRPRDSGFASVGDLLDAPEVDAVLDLQDPSDPRLSTRRDRAYLRWRYAESPLPYHAAWEIGDRGRAALVFHLLQHSRGTELRLCEIFSAPDRESVGRARRLISEAARGARAGYVTAFAPAGTPDRRVVRGAGFVPLPRLGPVLTVRPLNPCPVDPRLRRSWRPSIGELELF